VKTAGDLVHLFLKIWRSKLPKIVSNEAIVKHYVDFNISVRATGEYFGIDHHRTRRILLDAGVDITRRRPKRPISEETRLKMSEARRGKSSWCAGKKHTEEFKRKVMKSKLNGLDIDRYQNYERLRFLTRYLAKWKSIFDSNEKRQAFLDKFHNDPQFVKIYEGWHKNEKNRWWYPSLDHKVSRSQGGDWSLDNLQFITWFENRAKAEMSDAEWAEFQKTTGTTSLLFVRA
jgi:hypothetical protein